METIYNSLQLREIFHLEFLRWFGRKAKAQCYALKGGSNLRFFFNSIRYSEDMDLDDEEIKKAVLADTVMNILENASFKDSIKPFGIERVVFPDMAKAKQTDTTQRFKIHLLTFAGDDLFTKIEFSRRGFGCKEIVQPVGDTVLRPYKLSPLIVPHYDIHSAITQKIGALALRAVVQARDIFDLYILAPQYEHNKRKSLDISKDRIEAAGKNIFTVTYGQFKDTVAAYLLPDDQAVYANKTLWDEIVLKTANFIEEFAKG